MSTSQNSKLWSVRTEEGVAGPYTVDQMRSMVRDGTLDRHTPIKAEGSSSWIRAGQYPAIFAAQPNRPRPSTSQQTIGHSDSQARYRLQFRLRHFTLTKA